MSSHRKISKLLSLVLRHQPEVLGVQLDPFGWIEIDELLAALKVHGNAVDRDLLEAVVRENDKQRFMISDDSTKIRASQGHSIPVDLELTPIGPPETLWHGTVEKFLDSIRKHGLKPQSRQYCHLSDDLETAKSVGSRRGKPVILVVESQKMAKHGHEFYRSANGVWLTDQVPAEFIRFP